MDLKRRGAVITGAGSGMGRATARAFADAGARLALFDIDANRALQVAGELADVAVGIEADVSDPDSVAAAMASVDEVVGPVHVCVNAAGVPTPGKIVKDGEPLPLDQFRRVIEVNLIGAFDVMRQCAARMVRNDPDEGGERGVIINVSSGAAWQGQRGQAAYGASKAGLIGLTLPVARDLSTEGIRVVAVAPGLFDTQMASALPEAVRSRLERLILNPKRLGDPREFAQLARHIVENPYLNATTISLDAGARLI